MSSDSAWILLARILRPQGRKGEVLADLFTRDSSQFQSSQLPDQPHVWLAAPGFTEGSAPGSAQPQPTAIRACWLPVGRNAGRIVLHLAGIETISQAEALAGVEIVIPASERPALEPGAVYISDLAGAAVFDGDLRIGTVEDVQFPMSADGLRRLDEAAPLLVLRSPEGDELLIPFVKAYIREMDLDHGQLRMELPPGLLELNRPAEVTTSGNASPKTGERSPA